MSSSDPAQDTLDQMDAQGEPELPELPEPQEIEVEMHFSNPETTLRLQVGFAAAVEYVMREQQEPGQELTTADILAALRGSLLSLAKNQIADKAQEPGKLANAHVNKRAFLSVLDGIAEEIESWEIPALSETELSEIRGDEADRG